MCSEARRPGKGDAGCPPLGNVLTRICATPTSPHRGADHERAEADETEEVCKRALSLRSHIPAGLRGGGGDGSRGSLQELAADCSDGLRRPGRLVGGGLGRRGLSLLAGG